MEFSITLAFLYHFSHLIALHFHILFSSHANSVVQNFILLFFHWILLLSLLSMPVALVLLLLHKYKICKLHPLQTPPPPKPKNIQHFVQTQNKDKMSNLFCQPVQINDFCGRQSVGVSDPARCLLRSGWPFVLSVNGIFWCLISTGGFFFGGGLLAGGAADVPVLPAHHQERADSDRGAAHQNAIRTPLATRLPD